MNKISTFIVLLLIVCSAILFAGCAKDSEDSNGTGGSQSSTAPVVTVLYDANGLGDRSYNDLIYTGVEQSALQNGVRTLHISPATRAEGLAHLESVLNQMSDARDGVRRLLIVAGSGYEEYLRANSDILDNNDNADLLFLETSTPLTGKGSTLYLPYYGAMYEAGALTPHFGNDVILIIANSASAVLDDARQGFSDGFNSNLFPTSQEKKLTTHYLSNNVDEGFTIADSTALQILSTFHDDYSTRLVVPVCGGAASVFADISEILGNFIYMGVDHTVTSASCPYSAVKHIDKAVSEEIGYWLSAVGMPKHLSLGLAEGYTGVEIHIVQNTARITPIGELTDALRQQIHEEAVRKEAEHEE